MSVKAVGKIVRNRPVTARAEENRRHLAAAIRTHLENNETILRRRQLTTAHRIADRMEEGSLDTYVDSPAGAGKTVVFSQIVKSAYEDGHKPKTLIVTDSQELVEQTKLRFNEFAPNLSVGLFYEYEKQLDKPIVITTYKSLPYIAKNHASKFDFLLLDEAHKSLSEKNLAHRQEFDNAAIMAFTATPAYSSSKDLEQYFELADRLSITEAIDESLICGFRSVLVHSNHVNLDDIPLKRGGDYEEKALAKAINTYARNLSAAEFYRDQIDPYTGSPLLGKKGIVNCGSIQHCYDAAKIFQEVIPRHMIGGKDVCVAIHGDSDEYPSMSKKFRNEILKAHRNGEIFLLTQNKLLIHGYDDPTIELCFNLAPTRSEVVVRQRMRASRLDPNNPEKITLVADFMDEVTQEDHRNLIYGDVVGRGHYVLPEEERRMKHFIQNSQQPYRSFKKILDSHKTKKIQVSWYTEEINEIIRNNAIALQNSRLETKQVGEFSALDIANEAKVSYEFVLSYLKSMIPFNLEKGEYIDPRDKNKNPTTYRIAERMTRYGLSRYLKEESLNSFLKNCILNGKKMKDEFSALDISKKFGIDFSTVHKNLYSLIPYQDNKDKYIDPEDKSDNPVIYRVVDRQPKEKVTRYIKEADMPSFVKNCALKNRKQENERSFKDLAIEAGTTTNTLRGYFDGLIPVEGKKNHYINPNDTSEDPYVYRIRKQKRSGFLLLYIQHDDSSHFLENVVYKNRKQEGESSLSAIANKGGIHVRKVTDYINTLTPVKGKKDQYIDPNDATENPYVYFITKKKHCGKLIPYVRNSNVSQLLEKCIEVKELSGYQIAKENNLPEKATVRNINSLIPLPGKEGQYIDRNDTSENPQIFNITERRGPKTTSPRFALTRYLKKEDVPLFIQKFFPEEKKEIGLRDVARETGISHTILMSAIKKLVLVDEKQSLYVNPHDKSDNPTSYHIITTGEHKSKNYFFLKEEVESFLKTHELDNLKRKGEFSPSDIAQIFGITTWSATNLLKNYPVSVKDADISEKFSENIEVVIRNSKKRVPTPCITEATLDIFARQNNLEYRDPEMQKKYEALAAKKPKPE